MAVTDVTWETDDIEVATVADGIVTGYGNAEFSANVDGACLNSSCCR